MLQMADSKIPQGHMVEDFGATPSDLPTPDILAQFGARLCIVWPIIDVEKVREMPNDYPGPMAVPITLLDKIGHDSDAFRIVGKMHHGVLENGKRPYQKLIVINMALRKQMASQKPGRR